MSTPAAVTAESLFVERFLPLYPEDAKADLARARSADANPAKNPHVLAHLDEAAAIFAARADALFGADGCDVSLDFSDASVHRLSAALTRARRDAWSAAEGELFNVVVHGAAYVGACVVRNHHGLWAVRRPLWESLVQLRSRAGDAELAVFHWWLKSLADDALDGKAPSLADRYRTHVEVPSAPVAELPVIAPEDRKLPRLAKGVRYDVLYKHLRAHLPELRDLGADFPSAERFAEYAFKWLGFALVGGGRMLVMHGQNADGVHLFWLGASGFEKSAIFPADAFPEHVLQVEGEKLRIVASVGGKTVVHEMLWWGL
jgi:hypothetical protein